MAKPIKENPILQRLIGAAEKNAEKAKLCSTCPLKEIINDELKEILTGLYGQKDPRLRATGSVVNAIFKERKRVFMLSKTSMEKLFAGDKNLKRNTVGGDYASFHSYLVGNDVIKKITDGKKHRAMSVYELIEPGLVRLFEEQFGHKNYEQKRAKCLEAFNTYIKSNSNKLPKKASFDSDVEDDLDIESEVGGDAKASRQQPDHISIDSTTTELPTLTLQKNSKFTDMTFADFQSLAPEKQISMVKSLDSLPPKTKEYIADLELRLPRFRSFTEKQLARLFDIFCENTSKKDSNHFNNRAENQIEETPEILEERRRVREIADEIFKRK